MFWLGVCSWLVGWIGVGLACARGVADSGAALAHSRAVVFHEGCGVGFPASYECVYVMVEGVVQERSDAHKSQSLSTVRCMHCLPRSPARTQQDRFRVSVRIKFLAVKSTLFVVHGAHGKLPQDSATQGLGEQRARNSPLTSTQLRGIYRILISLY